MVEEIGGGMRKLRVGTLDILTNAPVERCNEMQSGVQCGPFTRVVPYSPESFQNMPPYLRDETMLRIMIAARRRAMYTGDTVKMYESPPEPHSNRYGEIGTVVRISPLRGIEDFNQTPYLVSFPDGKTIEVPYRCLALEHQHPSNKILEEILIDTNEEFAQVYLSRALNQGLPVS